MEYKFVSTVQGPAIIGEDEILFFNQFGQMLDYHESNPTFLAEAKKFISDGLVQTASDMGKSMFEPVTGGDLSPYLYGYASAMRYISDFEFRYLPGIPKG